MSRPKITRRAMQERRERAFELLKKGLSYAAVAKAVGCAKSSIVLWRRQSADGGTTAPPVRWHKSERKAAAAAALSDVASGYRSEGDLRTAAEVPIPATPAPWATPARLGRIARLLRSATVLALTGGRYREWTAAAVLVAYPPLADEGVTEAELEGELLRAGFRRTLDRTWLAP